MVANRPRHAFHEEGKLGVEERHEEQRSPVHHDPLEAAVEASPAAGCEDEDGHHDAEVQGQGAESGGGQPP